jgi:hypothetical protein
MLHMHELQTEVLLMVHILIDSTAECSPAPKLAVACSTCFNCHILCCEPGFLLPFLPMKGILLDPCGVFRVPPVFGQM